MTYAELTDMVALRLEKQSGFTLTAYQANSRAIAILDEIDQHDGLVVEPIDPDPGDVG